MGGSLQCPMGASMHLQSHSPSNRSHVIAVGFPAPTVDEPLHFTEPLFCPSKHHRRLYCISISVRQSIHHGGARHFFLEKKSRISVTAWVYPSNSRTLHVKIIQTILNIKAVQFPRFT